MRLIRKGEILPTEIVTKKQIHQLYQVLKNLDSFLNYHDPDKSIVREWIKILDQKRILNGWKPFVGEP